jgi:hypothetical protein
MICSYYNKNMFVILIAFAKEHKHMLAHTKELMEYRNGQVTIHPRFKMLIFALRTAVEKGEGQLDKEATSHNDYFDAFRLSYTIFYDLRLLLLKVRSWIENHPKRTYFPIITDMKPRTYKGSYWRRANG